MYELFFMVICNLASNRYLQYCIQ